MLVERWLDDGTYAERFRGTIRVNPDDIDGALREIERWKDHPRVVQIGVPLQSRELYGKPQFKPLWEAAAEAGLPVAVHIEIGHGIDFPPTPSGITRTYPHYVSFMALNYLYHLMNMIAEGVFERFPTSSWSGPTAPPTCSRRSSGGWTRFGRPHLEQTPWAPQMPSAYLPGHVLLRAGRVDGPGDAEFAGEWLGMTGKEDMVMFGSSYPHWQHAELTAAARAHRPTARQAAAGATPPSSTASTSRPASARP